MILLEWIAWGSTLAAFIFLVQMVLGLDDLFGGMLEARIVAFFGSGLGWGSLLMVENGYSLPASLAVGVAAGALLGAVALGFVLALRRVSASTEASAVALDGIVAEVLIAPDSSMLGMVRAVHRGQLSEFPAIFETAVPVGGMVEVVESVAGRLKVRLVDAPTTPR